MNWGIVRQIAHQCFQLHPARRIAGQLDFNVCCFGALADRMIKTKKAVGVDIQGPPENV